MAKIFISYRREDCPAHAGRLSDRLRAYFGEDAVFMDIDTIPPGRDFIDFITAAVSSCDALIALIGDEWLSCTGRDGRRRLDDPDDFVRLEIAAALQRQTMVIPVLVERASMPGPEDLPAPLAPLARYHALEISDQRWRYDVDQLIRALETVLPDSNSGAESLARPGASMGEASTSAQARRPVVSPPGVREQLAGSRVRRTVAVLAAGALTLLVLVVVFMRAPADQDSLVPEITANRTARPSRDASGAEVTYEAAKAIDGDSTTAWRAPGDGRGAKLRLRFPEQIEIRRIGLLPGYAKIDPVDRNDRFFQNRRIVRARYHFGDQSVEADFEEKPIVQFTDVHAITELVIIEVLETTSDPERDFTAISEIQVVGSPT